MTSSTKKRGKIKFIEEAVFKQRERNELKKKLGNNKAKIYLNLF